MNWKHVQCLCWIIFSMCRCLQSARGHYYGCEIGSFNEERAAEGGSRGTVYAVNKSCIFIRGFSFDGNRQGRDARFSVGRSLKPDDHGVLIPDETGSNKSLATYFQRDVLLNLPLDVRVTKISWIAVWDLFEKVHYGYINISQTLKPPEGKHLGAFIVDRLSYHFHMDDIIIDNIKQILFVSVGYDGLKAGSSVWIGNGGLESAEWTQEFFHKDRDLEFSSQQPLNISITLPGNLTVDDLDSVRIWIDEEDQIFGHFIISDEDKENLPPYLPNVVEMKHCEVLLDEVYQVSWQLDEFKNKITLELSGRITLNEYMAFGISGSDEKMVGSDVIVVWIDPTTNEPQAEDYHVSDNSQCIGNIGIDLCPDTFVPGGTNNVQLIGAVIRDGITTIRVGRPLTSDDSLDNPIQTDRPGLTFWSLWLRFKSNLISHSQLYTSGMRKINFGTSEVSDCADLESSVEEEKKDSSTSKLFPALSDNIEEEVPSFTGRHISKRNAGSPDPVADLVTNACCFTDCQNGGIGFATVNQQLQCVCPFPWTGPGCAMTTTPCNPDPCQNGGTCSVVSSTAFRCDCTAGFTGTFCGLVDGGPFQVLCPSNVHLLTTAGNSQPVSATWQEPDAPSYQFIMRSHTPGDLFSVGETIVDYTFGTSQGTQTCTFCVTVQEVTVSQPTLDNCLDVTSSSSSQGGMNVTFTEPTASDNCGPVSLLSATARSGDFFPMGSTSVYFVFQDHCEELSFCTFNVTVSDGDNIPPDVTCPQDIDVEVEINTPGTVVTWADPVTFDINLPVTLVSQSHLSGNVFRVGTTEVTYRYADNANNIGMCSFRVTVTAMIMDAGSSAVYLVVLVIPFLLLCIVVVIIFRRYQKKSRTDDELEDKQDANYGNSGVTIDPEDDVALDEKSRNRATEECQGLSEAVRYEKKIQGAAVTSFIDKSQKRPALRQSNHQYEDVKSDTASRKLPIVSQLDQQSQDESEYEVPEMLNEYAGVYVNTQNVVSPSPPTPIKVTDFKNFMKRGRSEVIEEIIQQFMALQSGKQYPWNAALKPQNKPKNFFKSLLPYDHSRVKLDTDGNNGGSDYINASYIKNHRGKVSFIAAQGPRDCTKDDFWKMVWQEDVETIVMLVDKSEIIEQQQYWPSKVDTSLRYGDITVLLMESTGFRTHTVRKMNVLKGNERVHTLKQFEIPCWRYGGVPSEPADLISVIKQIKTNQERNKHLLVHCSNGVGATGTFIALYDLMDVIQTKKEVSVFDIIEGMRKDRTGMVLNKLQYLFIFDALLEAMLSPDSQMSCDQLKKLDPQAIKKKAKKEFQMLKQSHQIDQDMSLMAGSSPENKHKNRFQNLIPMDKYRPVLSSTGILFGFNDYVNATIVKDISEKDFIMTQSPLASTVEDFWRLVLDYDCTSIVMLNTIDDSDESLAEYWPDGHNATGSLGLISVTCKKIDESEVFTKRQFEVNHKRSQKSILVDHFSFHGWTGDKPDVSKLMEFIKYTKSKGPGPDLVHCINGVGLSAVYVTVVSELERMEKEGIVDVYGTVKRLHKKCPAAIQTEEYCVCYQLLRDHLNNPNEYAVVF